MSTTTAVASHSRWRDTLGAKNSTPSIPAMPFVHSRPTSPLHPRVSSRNTAHSPFQWNTRNVSGTKSPDLPSPQRSHNVSEHSKDKPTDVDPKDSRPDVYGLEKLSDHPNGSSTTFSTLESALRTTYPEIAALPKRSRNSFFGAASEALTFKLGKKRLKTPTPTQTSLLPEVIEITATRRASTIEDTEEEERERLRDAAAQSIGLDPDIMSQKPSGLEDESEEEREEISENHAALAPDPLLEDGEGGRHTPPMRIERSLSFTSQTNSRHRSGSLAHSNNHRRSNSIPPQQTVPGFPTTVSSLTPFIQIDAVLPKHYPAPSLLRFSLAKQWKTRYIIMTSPTSVLPTGGYHPTSAPTVSYLHLFKSKYALEKELERLEINEDSVVFVSEHNEEIGGRRNVLRVGGVDCGAMRKVLNLEENGRTTWVLQVTEPQELQKWITAVKNSVLGQRSVRAGLGLPSQSMNGTEPRGDLDVMLSIRAQGIMSSSTNGGLEINRARSPSVTAHHSIGTEQSTNHTVSTPSSLRSNSNVSSIKSSSNAVSTLKGLFTVSSRSRSPSVAASTVSEESFSSMGNNLLSLLRSSQSSVERPMSPLVTGVVPSPPQSPPPPQHQELQLERKIAQDLSPDQWLFFKNVSHASGNAVLPLRADRRPFVGSSALQPPPRRRPVTAAAPSYNAIDINSYKYTHANSSAAESLGVSTAPTHPPLGPNHNQPSLGTPERKPRIPSWSSSTSSFASGASSEGSSSRRWSRQGTLPRRLTPPSGSPPPVPTGQRDGGSTPRIHSPHPYSPEESPTRSSSVKSGTSPRSVLSNVHPFSKRASGSSFQSTSSSHTRVGSSRSNRISMPPPPRPAPCTALPPTPTSETTTKPPSPTPSAKIPFRRDSFAHRALRLSLAGQPPSRPPSTSLPLRPDEDGFVRRERTGSSGSVSRNLHPVPPSPDASEGTLTLQNQTDSKQHTSIKQRLRILSAPSTIPSAPLHRPVASDESYLSSSLDSEDESVSSVQSRILVGEPITTMQNDPSFLLLATPIIEPPTPPSSPHPRSNSSYDPAPASAKDTSEMPVIASLSPPPWRSLRKSCPPDDERGDDNNQGTDDDDASANGNLLTPVFPPRLSSAVSIANLSI